MEEFEKLEGWTTITDAAERLKFSRQNLHKKIKIGSIPAKHVREIGDESRRILVIRTSYVDGLVIRATIDDDAKAEV